MRSNMGFPPFISAERRTAFDTFAGNGTTVYGGGTAIIDGGRGDDGFRFKANLTDTDGNPATPTIINFEDVF